MKTSKTHETTAPTWPTVRIRLSRPGECEDSVFVQMERCCPMARGQRCLILAPTHNAVAPFLTELRERIVSLNPQVEARLARADAVKSAADVQALADTAQRRLREGGHVVVILESLNAVLDRNAGLMEACKRLFGAAQATDAGGTVTVVAAATEPPLAELDRDVLRQFRGTGNMEVGLRFDATRNALAVEPTRSGTKHAERIAPAR